MTNPNLKRHAELFDGLATRLGHDMQKHVLEDDLSMDDVAEAVVRCSHCAFPDACMMNLRHPDPITETPVYCQNIPLFENLRANKQ